jgi:hypothetical protein
MANLPSQKFSLKVRDFLKGALVAVGTAVLPNLITILNSGIFPKKEQLILTGIAGLAAFLTYIGKNFFTDDTVVAEKVLTEARQEQIDKATK